MPSAVPAALGVLHRSLSPASLSPGFSPALSPSLSPSLSSAGFDELCEVSARDAPTEEAKAYGAGEGAAMALFNAIEGHGARQWMESAVARLCSGRAASSLPGSSLSAGAGSASGAGSVSSSAQGEGHASRNVDEDG